MNQAIVAARVVAQTAEGTHELPIPPIGFLLIAAFIFLFLLAVTFAFRSIGHRHAPEAYVNSRHTGSGPDSHGH